MLSLRHISLPGLLHAILARVGIYALRVPARCVHAVRARIAQGEL